MVVGVIPARAGSVTIPNKALKEICGIPLLQFTIRAAEKSLLKKVIVTADYPEDVINPLINDDKVIYVRRPEEYCRNDQPSTIALNYMYDKGIIENYDIICLLQPTSPLRGAYDINMALLTYFLSTNDSLVSVFKTPPIKKMYMQGAGKISSDLTGFNKDVDEMLYTRNGAIYIFTMHNYLERGIIFDGYPEFYVMESYKSIDVDTFEDLKHVELLIKGGVGNV